MYTTSVHRSTEQAYSDRTIVEVQMLSGFQPYAKDLERVSPLQSLPGKAALCRGLDASQSFQAKLPLAEDSVIELPGKAAPC